MLLGFDDCSPLPHLPRRPRHTCLTHRGGRGGRPCHQRRLATSRDAHEPPVVSGGTNPLPSPVAQTPHRCRRDEPPTIAGSSTSPRHRRRDEPPAVAGNSTNPLSSPAGQTPRRRRQRHYPPVIAGGTNPPSSLAAHTPPSTPAAHRTPRHRRRDEPPAVAGSPAGRTPVVAGSTHTPSTPAAARTPRHRRRDECPGVARRRRWQCEPRHRQRQGKSSAIAGGSTNTPPSPAAVRTLRRRQRATRAPRRRQSTNIRRLRQHKLPVDAGSSTNPLLSHLCLAYQAATAMMSRFQKLENCGIKSKAQ